MLRRILHKQIECYSRHFSTSYFSRSSKLPLYKLNFIHHTSCRFKIMVSHENDFAYNVISKNYIGKNLAGVVNETISTDEDLSRTLDQNWRLASATEIVNTFKNVKEFCARNQINLADTRFDKLVDGLMDQCENLSTDEIKELLVCISEFPPCDSYSAHNFHDIWSCLDDVCCFRLIEWDIETSLEIAKIWYRLKLGRLCDYIFVMIDRHIRKAKYLTKDQLVSVYFLFNVCRGRAVDFELEHVLDVHIKDMTVDEMAVVAMGYFKTKTKIKILSIMETMVQKITENTSNINEISLAALLKILRYSKPHVLISQLDVMLDKIYDEIPRLSDVCCLHIALLGTGIQTYHPKTLQRISDRLINKISDEKNIRLKDIERILNVLSMYDFDPKTDPDFFKCCFEEIHKPSRLQEEVKYVRSLISTLNYLSLRDLYSYELMDHILDADYIRENFGKNPKMLPRELFSIDCCIDIECSTYKGNRLTPEYRYKATKWLTEFTPSYGQYKKITAADKFILDVIDTVQEIVVDKRFLFIHHILPHFPRADIILCKDKTTNKYIEPFGFQNYIFGDIMFPFKDSNLEWIALIIVGWNNTVRNTSMPLGHTIMKKRQLAKIGYHPVYIIWNEFLPLNAKGRTVYISNKLNEL